MQTHDWVTATLSAIAIAISVYNLVTARMVAKKAEERERDKLWLLETKVIASGHRAAYITAGSPSIRYLSATAIEPRGLKIRKCSLRVNDHGRAYYAVPDVEDSRGVTVFSEDDSAISDALVASLILDMPPRPSWSRSAGTLVRLAVRYEDIDAKRARHEIEVRAQDVPWRDVI